MRRLLLGFAVVAGVCLVFAALFIRPMPEFFGEDDPSADLTPDPKPSSSIRAYTKKCAMSHGGWRNAVVDYPKQLSSGLNEASTYKAVVDIRRRPAAPETVIPYADEAVGEPVLVRCVLAARLIAVSDTIEVRTTDDADGSGWRFQRWTPQGVIEWSWIFVPESPETQKLRLELTPAVIGGPARFGTLRRVSYESQVATDSTRLERLSYWFNTDWHMLGSIAGTLAVAVVAILGFSAKVREQVARLFSPGSSEPSQEE